jgi:uncharacterized protein YndB with AHSA1/START domain
MITVEAIIKAPISEVWDKYTNPIHIVNWNFANDDWCCPHASNDLTVGGKYNARMEAKDGSFGFDFEAIYEEVDLGSSFVYTMLDGRKCEVTMTEIDGSTSVIVSFETENENSEDLQRQGWQAILDNFKNYAEQS